MPPHTRRPRIFYGWVIVAISFWAQFVATGVGFYSFGVFFKPLTQEFGWTRAQTGFGFMASLATSAFLSPFLGRYVDKHGTRTIMPIGAVFVCLTFLLMSEMRSLWQFIAIFGVLLSASNSAMGGLPAMANVANWFERRRGWALGISTMGVSLSGIVLPPIVDRLLHTFGWRNSFRLLGLLPLVLVLPWAAIFIRHRPEDMGLMPDNEPRGYTFPPKRLESKQSLTPREILRSPQFWKITVAFALALFPLGTLLVQQAAFLTDIGIDAKSAAYILSLSAGFGVLGKIVFGALTDYFEQRFVTAMSFALQAVGVIVWLHWQTFHGAIAFALIFGFGMGGVVPLNAAIRATYFGARSFGTIAGIAAPFTTIFQMFGQPFSGHIFDVTGSYTLAFYTYIGTYALAIAVILSVRSERFFPVIE